MIFTAMEAGFSDTENGKDVYVCGGMEGDV